MKDSDLDTWKNQLYFGDNLEVLRKHIPISSVDLIYLDPPFNSNATYNVLFAEQNGTKSGAQITAFDDTWHWGVEAEAAFDEVVHQGIGPKKLADLLLALRSFLGNNDMMAYITMMAARLVEMHRVLKPSGSIFLHCDPTAGHYVKLLLDSIFGPKNFRNEIIWKRSQPKGHAKIRLSRAHDIIFFYAKSDEALLQPLHLEHDAQYLKKFYRFVEPETGRRYRLGDLTNPNKDRPNLTYEFPPGSGTVRVWRWTKERMMQAWESGRIVIPEEGEVASFKRYLDEMSGTTLTDVWDDIEHLHGSSKERLGYPTQKPEALLERIITLGSSEGDLVLDPFCGCGTAVAVAERLNRRWIGIDVTHLAIKLIKKRLQHTFPNDPPVYEVIGEPRDLKSAEALALEDRHKFEWWALDMVDARPAQDKRKGADWGIDGVIYFQERQGGKTRKIIVQVKSGSVGVGQIMEFKAAIEREQAVIGAFITLKPPTRRMTEEAAAAGFYEPEDFPGHRFPRLQILTGADLFAGKKLQYPHWAIQATFKKAAPRRKGGKPEDNQKNLC
jgi:site-specific DNA-methyltransferase (adenine-specific)